jgi:hypothetical protein
VRPVVIVSVMLLFAGITPAQDPPGGIRGRLRAESGAAVSGAEVIVRRGDSDVASVTTDRKGAFLVYGLTFRKPGLSVGTLENIEVRAGRVRDLPDRLILKVDEGSLAFIKGSVFDAQGRSLPGARVDLARIEGDGKLKKIDGRLTNETGSFVFRLLPNTAQYRIAVSANGMQAASKDVEVTSAAVYRVAFSLGPSTK